MFFVGLYAFWHNVFLHNRDETAGIINHEVMKLFLFLAAIYSLIINQSHKKAWETVLPGEQKTKTQKVITGKPPSSIKLDQQQFVLHRDSIERLNFLSSNDLRAHGKWNEKEQQ